LGECRRNCQSASFAIGSKYLVDIDNGTGIRIEHSESHASSRVPPLSFVKI
jgi:hypothetical protein